VIFETTPAYSIKLSLDFIQTDEAFQSIKKVATRMKLPKSSILPAADMISAEYLATETEEEIFINLQEIKNGFIASGNHLFSFLSTYRFPRPVSYEEKVTVFCQMIGIFEDEFDVTDNYQEDDQVEYALVFPKQEQQITN
jgi:hypothetical protein